MGFKYKNHYIHCDFEWVSVSRVDHNQENCPLCGKPTPPFVTENAPPREEWEKHDYLLTHNIDEKNARVVFS